MKEDLNLLLERAITIAVQAHAGQRDKAGAPYILHPLRVMFALEGNLARIVGVLHDVVEDSPDWSLERLRAEGMTEEVLSGLESVTRRADESYEAFVSRAAAHPVGRLVKLADLDDNLDVRRLATVTEKDQRRLAKYLRARAQLNGEATP